MLAAVVVAAVAAALGDWAPQTLASYQSQMPPPSPPLGALAALMIIAHHLLVAVGAAVGAALGVALPPYPPAVLHVSRCAQWVRSSTHFQAAGGAFTPSSSAAPAAAAAAACSPGVAPCSLRPAVRASPSLMRRCGSPPGGAAKAPPPLCSLWMPRGGSSFSEAFTGRGATPLQLQLQLPAGSSRCCFPPGRCAAR